MIPGLGCFVSGHKKTAACAAVRTAGTATASINCYFVLLLLLRTAINYCYSDYVPQLRLHTATTGTATSTAEDPPLLPEKTDPRP